MYNERDYNRAGIITAYALSKLTFTHPFNVSRRYLQSSGDFQIATGAVPYAIPFEKNKGATITESHETDTKGTSYKVTVQFSIPHATAADIEGISVLKHANHLILSHLAGRLSIIRATDEGWKYEDNIEDGTLNVKLTINNANGLQRIIQ